MITGAALVDKFRYALSNKWGYIWGATGILWTASKQEQKVNYMVNKYGTSWKKNSEAKDDDYYNSALNGAKWIGHYVADCSGMFVWAFKETGAGGIAHGSNSIYDRYCSRKGRLSGGKRTDGMQLQPGTAVFCENDKTGKHNHIGLYAGDGKVIEAAGVTAGVCVSNITATKWKCWGELKAVQYGTGPEPEPAPEPEPDPGVKLPTLRRGSKGQYVTMAQKELLQRGYDLGKWGADGDFGQATEKAVKQFQRDWGLEQDGIIGPATWDMLLKAPIKEKTYTVTIRGLKKNKAEELKGQYPDAVIKEE